MKEGDIITSYNFPELPKDEDKGAKKKKIRYLKITGFEYSKMSGRASDPSVFFYSFYRFSESKQRWLWQNNSPSYDMNISNWGYYELKNEGITDEFAQQKAESMEPNKKNIDPQYDGASIVFLQQNKDDINKEFGLEIDKAYYLEDVKQEYPFFVIDGISKDSPAEKIQSPLEAGDKILRIKSENINTLTDVKDILDGSVKFPLRTKNITLEVEKNNEDSASKKYYETNLKK